MIEKDKIEQALVSFTRWLDQYGYYSYDVQDFWGSDIGIWSKNVFFKNRLVGLPFIVSLHFLDTFLPWSRYLFFKKKRFAIADAHFVLAYLNLYQYYRDQSFMDKAETLLTYLLKKAKKTAHGIGWGLPYDWRNGYGLFTKNLPLITVTPYCFDAFREMFSLTKEKKYLSALEQITAFVAYDIKELPISERSAASSYGLEDESCVINAIAYRALLLLQANELFANNEFKDKAIRNINFVLDAQNTDGSWYYAHDSRFIDNFHTCFVLKKLAESYKLLKDKRILEAVTLGYQFYRNNLVRDDHTLIHFYKSRYPKFRKIEMYDYAEGISLGVSLSELIDGAYDFSLLLANKLIKDFQLKKGYFVTRISMANTRERIPYLRWPQAQLCYALTKLLIKE